MNRLTIVAVVAGALLSACGTTAAPGTSTAPREIDAAGAVATVDTWLKAMWAADTATACRLETDEFVRQIYEDSQKANGGGTSISMGKTCESQITAVSALAKAFGLTLSEYKITVVATTDTTVTVKVTYTHSAPNGYVLTNTNGSWILSSDVSEQYKQAEASASASAAVATVSQWIENWCKVQKGMTKKQAETLMGAPTATFDATQATPQDQWQQGAYSFTVFFDTDGIVNRFWMSTDSLGKNDLAKMPCYKNRS